MKKLLAIVSLIAMLIVVPALAGLKGTKIYDRGIQNDFTGIPIVQWSGETGQYLYTDCGVTNVVLQGIGASYIGDDGSLVLQFTNGIFKGTFSENVISRTGHGVLWSKRRTIEPVAFVTDSNTQNDTFVCPKR